MFIPFPQGFFFLMYIIYLVIYIIEKDNLLCVAQYPSSILIIIIIIIKVNFLSFQDFIFCLEVWLWLFFIHKCIKIIYFFKKNNF